MIRAAPTFLLVMWAVLAPHDLCSQPESRVHPPYQRDLKLEVAVSRRYHALMTVLQPEAKRKLAVASSVVWTDLVNNADSADPYKTARTEVDARFARLSPSQADLLVFYVLADLAQQSGDEVDRAKRRDVPRPGDAESSSSQDRLQKLQSTLSSLLKKISDTANAVTQNIK